MAYTCELISRLIHRWGPVGDYQAGLTAGTADATKIQMTSGTTANKADRGAYDTRTLGIGANEDLDLQTMVDANNVAIALAEVVVLRITASSANAANVEVKPGAANGFTAILKDPTDVIQLKPGAVAHFECLAAAAYTVDATHKVINVLNTSGAATASYTISVAGRSA